LSARSWSARRLVIVINLGHGIEDLRLRRALAVVVGHCRWTVVTRTGFGGWSFRGASGRGRSRERKGEVAAVSAVDE
jgi:hypothetical protein